ncbi:DUF1573 domain-containing protein [Prevotella sp. oral taxon 376]|uniref:DUF1573 domain-containing protein n=1 Tax=Prevotella sp. oral taxon 376 TaxID=712466 RepID=UPI000D1DFDCB|nr:DUF1573 domain-containing protein [Prevotella sp. oral taxon 376]PTL32304.1 DUF1573 domain-containing protein [Prevotella sp. oral taxon 376]
MNKILIILLLLTFSSGLPAQNEPTYLKTFEYDKRIHDFGTILEKDGKVNHTFTFTNKGSQPIAITEVNAWCGCTSGEFSKKPVAPGKTGTVTVTYNPLNRPGKFSKEVVVLLNDGRNYTRIWIKGNVTGYLHPVTEDHPYAFGSGLYMGYKVLPFSSLRPGESYTFEQRIANDTDKPMVVEFEKTPDNRILKMPDRIELKAKERTTFKVSYKAVRQYPYDRYILVKIKVNGRHVKPMRITWFGSKARQVEL